MTPAALIIIDVQKGFEDPRWGKRNNLDAEQNIEKLLSTWRGNSWPIVHVQHCSTEPDSPLQPGLPGNEFKDEVTPKSGEKQITKSVNSAFIGTYLEEYLHSHNIQSLVMVGLTTDHCVSTTTRMAGNLGFDVTVISDATATFDRSGNDGRHHTADDIHEIHLASLNGEFCVVSSTEDVLKNVSD